MFTEEFDTNLETILQYQPISIGFIKKYAKENSLLTLACCNKNIPESFVERAIERIDLDFLLRNRKLSEGFLIKNIKHLSKSLVAQTQNVSGLLNKIQGFNIKDVVADVAINDNFEDIFGQHRDEIKDIDGVEILFSK